MKSHNAYPASSTRLSRVILSEVVGGYAASAASAASSRRPARPSADARSSAISYSRVAHPERGEFAAIARTESWLAGHRLFVCPQGAFKLEPPLRAAIVASKLCDGTKAAPP